PYTRLARKSNVGCSIVAYGSGGPAGRCIRRIATSRRTVFVRRPRRERQGAKKQGRVQRSRPSASRSTGNPALYAHEFLLLQRLATALEHRVDLWPARQLLDVIEPSHNVRIRR